MSDHSSGEGIGLRSGQENVKYGIREGRGKKGMLINYIRHKIYIKLNI